MPRLFFTVFFMGGTALLLWHSQIITPFALENGLVISGVLLALPVTWEHYSLFALPALGVEFCQNGNAARLMFRVFF
ncbi:MAG: hypothetical protein IPP40_05325 [bacterium]|nr:hypothetical protein [bacterium]